MDSYLQAASLQNIFCTNSQWHLNYKWELNSCTFEARTCLLVSVLLPNLPFYIYFIMLCLFFLASSKTFLSSYPRDELNNTLKMVSLFCSSLDPCLRLPHHWQVCSQQVAGFYCAMLCNAKSPARGQQPSFMLHYSDRGRFSPCLSFFLSFCFLSLHLFVHFSIVKPQFEFNWPFLIFFSFNHLYPPVDYINSTGL